MNEMRIKTLILLSGIFIATASPKCHAQDPGKLFDVKMPQAEVSPAFIPEITKIPAMRAQQEKPVKEVSEPFWYWRFLEMIAIGAAKYNTDKQSDGRPNPLGNFQ